METGKIITPGEMSRIFSRRPALWMLDKARMESENQFSGWKLFSCDEQFFQGHFPNHPIVPGVLQVEAMRQLAELASAEYLNAGDHEYIAISLMEKVKFRKPVVPGSRMKVTCEVLSREDGKVLTKCSTATSEGTACEARITLTKWQKSEAADFPEEFNEFDNSPETVYDLAKVMELMPHRYPFLLIDNVARVAPGKVTAIKNVTINEGFFQGHESECPVVPESILCEISAQAGCASVLSQPENQGKLGFFMAIDRVEFFSPVYPGDQLVCDVDLPPSKSRFGKGGGWIRANGRDVLNISLMFAIVDP